GVRELLEIAAVGVGLEDRHVRVEVPRVAPALASTLFLLALLQFLGVFVLRVGIEVTAGEDDLLAVRPEVAARRLADTGADTAKLARVQVQDEYLIKRIARVLFFRLEDDLLAVRREVAFAGAREILGDLMNVLQVRCFGALPVSWIGGQDEAGEQSMH